MSISANSVPVDCSLPQASDAPAATGLTAAPTDAAAFANLLAAFGPLAPASLPTSLPAAPLPGELTFVPADDSAPAAPGEGDETATPGEATFRADSRSGGGVIGDPITTAPLPVDGGAVHVTRQMKPGVTSKSGLLAAPHAFRQMSCGKAPAAADAPSVIAPAPSAGTVSSLMASGVLPESSEATPAPTDEELAETLIPAANEPSATPATNADPAAPASAVVAATTPAPEACATDSTTVDNEPQTVSPRANVPARRAAPDASRHDLRTDGRENSAPVSSRPAPEAAAVAAAATNLPRADAATPNSTFVSPAFPAHATAAGATHARQVTPAAAEFAAASGAVPEAGSEGSDALAASDSDAETVAPADADSSEPAPVFSATLDVRALPRGVEARSLNARFARAADSADEAVVPTIADRRSGRSNQNNTLLTAKGEGDVKPHSFAGIAAANVTATMIKRAFSPAEQTSVAQAATPVATLSPFLDNQNFEEMVPIAPPMVAVRAVMLAAERAVHAENPSVDLRFDLEGMASLHVRVECRDGVVHTTFRSDSAEMRDIISREWAAQTAQAEARGVRLAEPVFNTSTPPRNPDDSPSGRQRDRRSSRQSDEGAEIVNFNPRRSGRGRAAATAANSPLGFHAVA